MVAGLSNKSSNLSAVSLCRHCGQTQHLPKTPAGFCLKCVRCDAVLHTHSSRGIQRTVAYSVAALILFIPANTLPILSITKMGYKSQSTILGGVKELWGHGTPGNAILVLLCSIVIPLAKISGLLFLCTSWETRSPKKNSRLLNFIELIEKWSMLDVFLVAIFVALVKLGTIATINPEPGIVAFAAVVVLTMIASANFDPRLLWTQENNQT
jgi:paraquat-inducible protein A